MSVHPGPIDAFSPVEKRLYHPASPHEVSQTEMSLQELQRSGDGWQMADALLASDDANALVAYFLQSSDSWERCLLHLICSLSQGEPIDYAVMESQHSDIASRVVISLGPTQLLTAIWFATTLVEDVGRTSSESRLTSAWTVYGHGAWEHRSGQQELAPLRTMIPYVSPPLWDRQLFEVAADCWTELLGTFGQLFPPESMEHLEKFLTGPNAEELLLLIVAGEYEPDAMAYSRLLLTYGEVQLPDLARKSHTATGVVLIDSLMRLLTYDGYAGAEDDICIPAMEFWQAYSEHLVDEIGTTEPWMDSARQYLVRVLNLCWSKIRMPSEDVYAQWTSEAKGDFRVFRTDVVDLLQSAYTLLGSNIFNNLATLALDVLQKQMWLDLEATLFCLNALAEPISEDDTADKTLSILFGSDLFAAMTNDAIDIPSKTQQTAVCLIISYNSFFERHTELLLPMWNFLFVAIRTPAVADIAARAILTTADSCRKTLVSEIDAFLEQLEYLLISEDLESGPQEKVFGAIAAIIQAAPSEEQKIWSLSKLLGIVEHDIKDCEVFAEHQAPVGAEEKGLRAVGCLASIGKNMQEPDDIPIDLESKPVSQNELYLATVWTPSQDRMADFMYRVAGALGPGNGDVIEAVGEVFRTGFNESFPGPFVFSPSLIEKYIVSTSLRSPRLEHVLLTAGQMLLAHTSAVTTRIDISATWFLEHMFQLIAAMECKSSHTKDGGTMLTEKDNPSNEPEVTSSCINLATKYIPRYLHIFLLNPQYGDHVINFMLLTIRSMQCPEIMPRKSAGVFWTALFAKYDLKLAMHKFLEQYGLQATQTIINNIGGDCPRSELEDWAEPLRQMVSTQIRSKQWMKEALFSNSFPSSRVSDAEKKQFLEQVMLKPEGFEEDCPNGQRFLAGLSGDELRVYIVNERLVPCGFFEARTPALSQLCVQFLDDGNSGTLPPG
ncbi:MAG: hypothetical protein Q9226_001450 [Calogaya cf. arnoldii]